ncbi:MAG: hypothetical protein ACXW2I_17725 [Burkholderiales bacterium]|jgi:hypothetical protein
MSSNKYWDKSFLTKRWQEMNADEKAEWVKADLQRMSSLFAMLSSQVQEIGRAVKTIRKKLNENQ